MIHRHPITILCLVLSLIMLTSGLSLAKGGGRSSVPSSDLQTIRGIVKPVVEAVLASEIQALVKRMPFRDGDAFKKGDILVEFECAKYRAELSAAQADLDARQKTVINNEELAALHGIGRLEVDISLAELKKAQAVLTRAQVIVQGCRIPAPFAGHVVKTLVNPYESVNPYDDLVSIVSNQDLDIELILPSSSLQWIAKNSPFSFSIDETQKDYSAEVVEIGPRVDPVSQTIRVFGRFHKHPTGVLAGMSGSAKFPEGTFPAQSTFSPSTKPAASPTSTSKQTAKH
ncbi:efflux RND transporter periplasmic adaptor subunit [Candidatus Nitrospira neomarina]|uniref:Efflux RND transporter periplasmic adaptor subunit n=1 Tax=Candidatus Nitrospira neomarina TaxID=3020899 RepID=A0AA96GKY5_9BACT|nr:efflux RND transporter periplasmic adaptor subunit [Candidatus Nitrospira neomarina]WNM63861.1 efflux RND transporter periplasmic adaptor subunit [Candidatus Nitrospira neomarina]